MAEQIIYVAATRAEVRQAIALIPSGAFGAHNAGAIADQMMERCGLVALDRITKAYIIKARGGTDEAGEKWKPLHPKTIAARRGNRTGTEKKRGKQGYGRPSVALTAKQRDLWWLVYRQFLAKFKGDKSRAARTAWAILKAKGAQTLLSKYGNEQVDILRDTGIMYNSLSPGVETVTYHNIRSRAGQVFRVGRGEVIVGTNVPYAKYHHEGTRRIPQRRLWPEPHKWPSTWWMDIAKQARNGLIDIAILLITGRKL